MKKELYIHHIPGRLRVRAGAFKNDRRAAAVRRLLAGLPGVSSVETNSVTGSVTTRYDTARVTPAAILALLRRTGHLKCA